MNELRIYAQFSKASHKANHHGDLCRDTGRGVSFVLLENESNRAPRVCF